ncbi:hypothetical protein MGG_16810 [Pyricularia oryzae 70-15]|uniref:Uncharacterized protein n=1 Tax=Pyricularia oryzae (strain 70-15 / ATCC MYA-4617 / FGSC 8958) TaxID=242507 RepID=G4N283_PYRO7|nr:uncharacterized protein MGG_16810 [Pyricularia oryzae 70-15]EHA52495.1 hypothetical protein MGG_16810 [Pyricularia oryzae 70-15]
MARPPGGECKNAMSHINKSGFLSSDEKASAAVENNRDEKRVVVKGWRTNTVRIRDPDLPSELRLGSTSHDVGRHRHAR